MQQERAPFFEDCPIFAEQADSDNQVPRKEQVFAELYSHKTGFIPVRRDLYENLLRKENNRAARADFFEPLDDLKDKITAPTDDAIDLVDLNELFVKIELRAVLKIRMVFTQWAHSLISNTISSFKQNFASKSSNQAINNQPTLTIVTT